MINLQYYAMSDIGFSEPQNHINEDFAYVKEIETNEGKVYFGVVADGSGSFSTQYQPAILAAMQIEEAVERLCKTDLTAFLEHTKTFLQEAMVSASYSLGALKIADEQRFAGFATSLSCVIIHNNHISLAHSGNTRINLMRYSNKRKMYDVKQLTKDHTKGMELVASKQLTYAEYHLHPSRLEVTGGLGMSVTPTIQTFDADLKKNDFVLLTTDGIHNAIRPDVMFYLLQKSENCEDAVKAFIEAAKIEKYEDNMTALLFWNT